MLKLAVDPRRRTAVIPLPGARRLPERLEHQGETFVRKKELHVTLIGSRSRCDPAALRRAARGLRFAVKPTGRYRLVKKDTRRTLIELVKVCGQEEYYRRLEAALGLPCRALPRMPAHVTLFTEPGGGGIALYCAAEMKALSKPVRYFVSATQGFSFSSSCGTLKGLAT